MRWYEVRDPLRKAPGGASNSVFLGHHFPGWIVADHGHWVWENGENPGQWDPWSAGGGNDAGPNLGSPCSYYAAGALGDTWAVGACDANYSGICEFLID